MPSDCQHGLMLALREWSRSVVIVSPTDAVCCSRLHNNAADPSQRVCCPAGWDRSWTRKLEHVIGRRRRLAAASLGRKVSRGMAGSQPVIAWGVLQRLIKKIAFNILGINNTGLAFPDGTRNKYATISGAVGQTPFLQTQSLSDTNRDAILLHSIVLCMSSMNIRSLPCYKPVSR